jgi:hypothetical protein
VEKETKTHTQRERLREREKEKETTQNNDETMTKIKKMTFRLITIANSIPLILRKYLSFV